MATLQNMTIGDTGFLQLPSGTTAQRPTPAAGQMRFNSTTSKIEQYNAGIAAWVGTPVTGVLATGGDSVYDVDTEGTTYRVHVFTTTGNSTFTVTKGGEVEYLIVAGGGAGGGGDVGGGGGAGGLLTGTTTVAAQSYTVTVGIGGVGVADSTAIGGKGDPSSAFGFTAEGGGGGAGWAAGDGGDGGSGGGATFNGVAGTGTPGQGNNGGSAGLSGSNYPQCGGGGAGSAGFNPVNQNLAGDGGRGINSNITGINTFYAGGGGGGVESNATVGEGGIGGGGRGGRQTSTLVALPGTPNTGGGGGGDDPRAGANGGSGIVVIRYPLPQENPTTAAGKVISDGLVLDLDFAKPTVYNSSSGTVVADSRLNGVTGSIVNSFTSLNPRTHRAGIQFPSAGTTYFTLPKYLLNGLTAWTIDFWLERNTTNTIDTFLTCGAGNDFLWYFRDNELSFENTAASNLDYGVTNNVPFNFCATGTGGTITVYKNGVSVDTMDNTTTITVNSNFGQGIVFGQELDSNTGSVDSTQSWKGSYYAVKFYNRVLSTQEVEQNFQATRWRFGI